jgi:DUF4097 and DUF4098 domain-containing protein YvlB
MAAFETPEPISVTIAVPLGSVHFMASARGDTVVVVNPTDRSQPLDVEAAERTTIELVNKHLTVKSPKPRGLGGLIGVTNPGSVEVTIELPQGSDVRADTGLADLHADGRIGETRIRNGAGDVRLDQTGKAEVSTGAGHLSINEIRGDAELSTAGEMQIGRIDGNAEIKNLNGKTTVGEAFGRLGVKSANGDITVDRAHSDATAKTANGSIEIGEVRAGTIRLETGFGSIDVGIPEGTTAWVDASTRFGRVANSLESADGSGAAQTVDIEVRTSFGDIVIGRPTRQGKP